MFHTLRNSDGLASPGPGSVWRNENSADSFNINRFITYACCFLLLLIGNSPRAQSADITSMEFSEDGIRPALAASASGEFMLLFTRLRWDLVNQSQGGSPVVPPTHLFGRLFQADGAPKGDAFDVYTGAAFTGDAVVRSDQNGNFTCYWSIAPRSTPPGNSKPIIYSRRFDSNGRARTEAQSLITTGTEVEGNRILMTFDADMSPDGKSVVVWSESVDLYDAKSVIYAQRFDTRGRKAGPVIHVTTPEPPPNQSKTEVSVSMDDDGAFAVAWLHRYFPDFPSAELDIDLEVAVFEPDGRVQESHVVLRHEDLPFGHGHKDTRIKKVAGYGYVVMTNHTTRPELEVGESISDKLYSSTFEGRFYPDGEAPSEIFSSDVFEVKGRSIFDLTIAASGKIGLVFEDIQSEVNVTRFAEINSDFTDVLSVQILNANGELSLTIGSTSRDSG
jgi:hypothetical protein